MRNLFTSPRIDFDYEKSLDYFPTPGWVTRALCEHIIKPSGTVLEPCCGNYHMSNILKEYFGSVTATDLIHGQDFLKEDFPRHDWVITNPPFTLASKMILKSLENANNVAMLTRLSFLSSLNRFEKLFTPHPPSIVAIFPERIGFKYGKTEENLSSAVDYCWVVWEKDQKETKMKWLPICKKTLSRKEDWY